MSKQSATDWAFHELCRICLINGNDTTAIRYILDSVYDTGRRDELKLCIDGVKKLAATRKQA